MGRTFKKKMSILWQRLYSSPFSKRKSISGFVHINSPFSDQPLHSLCSAFVLSLLSLSPAFSCSVLLSLHTLSPLPCPLLCLSSQPILLSLPSPVYGGVVNAMSFLSLSAVRVAIAGDELPVDNFVFAEHSDSQCGVIPPKLATCENSPFGSPLLRWVSNPPGANQSTETGNQVTS